MKIKNIATPTTILMLLIIAIGCGKKKNTQEEDLKKKIKNYQKLDRETITKVFHFSEMNTLKQIIKEKCKLLDIEINSFYVSNPEKKKISLSLQTLKIDMNCEYADLSSFIHFVKTYKKHMDISELIIDSNQTGYHRMYITINLITKDYLDSQYLPKVIKAVTGLSIDNIDYLKSSLKVYKTRHYFVSRILKLKSVNWKEMFKTLKLIPKNSFIKKLHYYRALNNEQVKLIVHLLFTDKVIMSTNQFFENHSLKKYFKNFSKKKMPNQLEDTNIATTTYLYQK